MEIIGLYRGQPVKVLAVGNHGGYQMATVKYIAYARRKRHTLCIHACDLTGCTLPRRIPLGTSVNLV